MAQDALALRVLHANSGYIMNTVCDNVELHVRLSEIWLEQCQMVMYSYHWSAC